MNGQLREHPLAELIREISVERISGVLRLARERVKALVYFDAGAAVLARSNVRAHRLAESLRRWGPGVIAPEQIDRVLRDAMTDAEAAAALVAAGLLNADRTRDLFTRQYADVLRPMLLWADGEWAFDTNARPGAEAHASLALTPLLIEAARRLPSEFVASRVARDEEIITPPVDAGAAASRAQIALTPIEAFVLSRVETPLTVGELVAISGVSDAAARQSIYTLAIGGLLTRANWPRALSLDAPAALTDLRARTQQPTPSGAATTASAPGSSPEGAAAARFTAVSDARQADYHSGGQQPPPPDLKSELEALFLRAAAADNYAVLDVGRNAKPGDIKRAYYALAKRFHPDRFHHEVDGALRTRIENSFASISQAYEVLKDATTRAAYDLKLTSTFNQAHVAPGQANNSTPQPNIAATGGGAPQPQQHQQRRPVEPPAAAQQQHKHQQRAEESFQKGLAALKQGNQKAAVQFLAEAAQLAPKQPRYRAHYGRALALDARSRRQAEAEFLAAIALDARNAGYHVMLAELYRDVGLRRRAIGEVERARAIDPQHADARHLLESLEKAERGS